MLHCLDRPSTQASPCFWIGIYLQRRRFYPRK
jgi:hypothetical protein